jgi:AcrR family transcriptional regulator
VTTTTTDEGRRLRADAQYNHDRLLQVAARHLAADGSGASMKAIAHEAGVGIGTLYRRFPSRELLVEAAYRRQSQRLAEAAPDLLRVHPPLVALRAWCGQFLHHMATRRGMADTLRTLLCPDDHSGLRTRDMLVDSVALMLRAGEREGELRPGLNPADVVLTLGGLAMITGEDGDPGQACDPARRERLLDVLLHGLTPAPDLPPLTSRP